MSRDPNADEVLKEQYADASNLNARASLHGRFSTNKYGWQRWVFDHIELPESCRVLELGCGPGLLWLENGRRIPSGWNVTLTDSSAGMLKEARRNLQSIRRKFAFGVVDAQRVPYADSAFDAVIANHMLYHVRSLDAALGEIRRVLAPGGCLYAATNGSEHMRELREMVRQVAPELPFGHLRGFRDFGLETGGELLSRYFTAVSVDHYDDSHQITEVEPVMAYVLSVPGAAKAFSDERRRQLEAAVHEEIADEGSFRVAKSAGLFIAR